MKEQGGAKRIIPEGLIVESGKKLKLESNPEGFAERREGSDIVSPLLRFNLEYKLKENTFYYNNYQLTEREKTTTDRFRDLDRESRELEIFSQEQGLNSLHTGAEYSAKVEEITKQLKGLDNKESLFKKLYEWKRFGEICYALIEQANDYIQRKVALDTEDSLRGKSLDRLTPDEMLLVERYQFNEEVKKKFLPYRFNVKIPTGDGPLRFINEEGGRQEERADYELEAEKLIDPKVAILILETRYRLFNVNTFADTIGIDIVTERPALLSKDVETFEDAERVSRPLPESLARWKENGLMGIEIPTRDYGCFLKNAKQAGEVASIILPDGTEDDTFKDYQSAVEEYNEKNFSKDKDEKLLALRRKIYEEEEKAFTEATQLLHPEIEWKVPMLAVYGISTGQGDYFGYKEVNSAREASGNEKPAIPLSKSFSDLRRFAYKQGVYLEPLKEEMARRISEEKFDPHDVAQQVRQALEEGRDPSEGSSEGLNWFIEEALFNKSTLDDEGKFVEGKGSNYKRDIAVTDDIINYLNNLQR
jgi:hypothetical protein